TGPGTAGTYTVTATSAADNTKSAAATVTVTDPAVAVSISPASASLTTGGNAAVHRHCHRLQRHRSHLVGDQRNGVRRRLLVLSVTLVAVTCECSSGTRCRVWPIPRNRLPPR